MSPLVQPPPLPGAISGMLSPSFLPTSSTLVCFGFPPGGDKAAPGAIVAWAAWVFNQPQTPLLRASVGLLCSKSTTSCCLLPARLLLHQMALRYRLQKRGHDCCPLPHCLSGPCRPFLHHSLGCIFASLLSQFHLSFCSSLNLS